MAVSNRDQLPADENEGSSSFNRNQLVSPSSTFKSWQTLIRAIFLDCAGSPTLLSLRSLLSEFKVLDGSSGLYGLSSTRYFCRWFTSCTQRQVSSSWKLTLSSKVIPHTNYV
jgi:hypothetical protein